MTAVIPTIQVLLDDGSGTYPIDITSQVSLSQPITVSGHGRGDEFSQAAAASFSCTLKNDDGSFTSGVGFGLGGFGSGFFGGLVPITVGRSIRYKQTKGATTVTRFTGQIESLDLTWGGGTGKASTVMLTAVDPLASMSLTRQTFRSMLEEEMLLSHPTGYYTLGEAVGATSAGDTSGNQQPPLVLAGSGAAVGFGTALAPVPDGLTAATFTAGQYLAAPVSRGSTYMVLAAISTTTPPGGGGGGTAIVRCGTELLKIDSTRHLTLSTIQETAGSASVMRLVGTDVVSSIFLDDGQTHLVGWAVDPSFPNGYKLYIDGSVSTAGLGTAPFNVSERLTVGSGRDPDGKVPIDPGTTAPVADFTGTISNVAVIDGGFLSNTDFADLYAVMSGTAETTAARFTRLVSYLGGTFTTSTPTNSGQLMGPQATSGVAPLDALETVTDAEGGVMFANGAGALVLQGRGYRAQKTTPTLTVPMKDIPAPTITQDTQQIVNSVTVTRTDGAAQLVLNTASIAAYGTFTESLDLPVPDDQSALSRAQWLVNKHGAPVQRMGNVTVNLLTSSIAESLIQTEIGDRWTLSGMPTQTPTAFGDLSVEGWSESLSVTGSSAEWSMTLNLIPWSLFTAWILEDPVYGVLDVTTIAG